ncbi:potassium channel family protein [Lacrimispora amygdalina]|uniref:potassium channel family protein n=1 Tax=Lacrimispora amygdalina TaxID=253257 RepID=UPI000BE314F4|nr:potassium channel family protein [Lacrimispora amygdalina]
MISMRINLFDNETKETLNQEIAFNDRNSIEFCDTFFISILNEINTRERCFTIGDIHISCENATIIVNNYTLRDTIYLFSFSDFHSSVSILKCYNTNLHIVDIDVKHMEIEKGDLLIADSKTGDIYSDASTFMKPDLEDSVVDNYTNKIDIRRSNVDRLIYHQSATSIVFTESNVREIVGHVRGKNKINVGLFSLWKSNVEVLQIGVKCKQLQFTDSFIRRLFLQSSVIIHSFEINNTEIQFVNECKLEYFEKQNLATWQIIKQGNYKKNVELYCQASYKVSEIENDLCIEKEQNNLKKVLLKISNNFLKICNGYGYKPKNAIIFSACVIIIFGFLFWICDFIELFFSGNMTVGIQYLPQNVKTLFEYIYLSGITFTTIGFTELGKLSWISRLFILIEGCLGVSTLSLFVTALVKKYSD